MEKRAGFPGQRIVVLPRRALRAMMQIKPALRGLTIAAAGFFPKAARHLRMRPRGSDQVIFIYCVKGAGWCDMGGKRHAVEPGDLLVVPSDVPHTYGAASGQPWSIYWFHAIGQLLPEYLRSLGITPERPVVWTGEDLRLIALFEEALEVIEHDYAYVDLLHASHTLAHLISLMVRLRQERGRGELDADQKVAQCLAYIKQHLEQPLSLGALAALANLSPSRFTELFRKQTGTSPHQYLQRLRIHQACQLLDSTNLNLKQIAAQLGYQDQFHFSRVFKTLKELSPKNYRRRSVVKATRRPAAVSPPPPSARPAKPGIPGRGKPAFDSTAARGC